MKWVSKGAMDRGDCLELIDKYANKAIGVGIAAMEKMITDEVGVKQLQKKHGARTEPRRLVL